MVDLLSARDEQKKKKNEEYLFYVKGDAGHLPVLTQQASFQHVELSVAKPRVLSIRAFLSNRCVSNQKL